MPKFVIHVPVLANEIYEVECESKEAAKKMYEDGLNFEHLVSTEVECESKKKEIKIEEQS